MRELFWFSLNQPLQALNLKLLIVKFSIRLEVLRWVSSVVNTVPGDLLLESQQPVVLSLSFLSFRFSFPELPFSNLSNLFYRSKCLG